MIKVRGSLALMSLSATLTRRFTVAFINLALLLGTVKGKSLVKQIWGHIRRHLQTYLCLVHLNQLRISVHLV